MLRRWSVVIVASLLLWSPLTQAYTITFEDGQLHGRPVSMAVPPQILDEGGNRFARITGSRGDRHAIVGHAGRNRSNVLFGTGSRSTPMIQDVPGPQHYAARVRFSDNRGSDGVFFELFQDAPNNGGYGTRDGQGPVFICWRGGAQVSCRANYANETKWNVVDLGALQAGRWYTFAVDAVWSHDPSQGRIAFSLDGRQRLLVTGRDSNLGPQTTRLPSFNLGMYGDGATGYLDVDDVTVSGGGDVGMPEPPPDEGSPVTPPAPPVPQPLPPPLNFRIVLR